MDELTAKQLIEALEPFANLLEYPEEFKDEAGKFEVFKEDIVRAQGVLKLLKAGSLR